MSSKLIADTKRHIAALFTPSNRMEVSELLLQRCGNNLPFCEKSDEVQLERIRFAALKLSDGDINKLREAIELANQDWRDLLVSAGFGSDTTAHKRWIPGAT